MRNLFNFILRNSHWLVAILLVAFSFYLVFTHNSYQRSVYLSSANSVVGRFYAATNQVTSFFYLKRIMSSYWKEMRSWKKLLCAEGTSGQPPYY